jgi:S1-C subfamily serine protease
VDRSLARRFGLPSAHAVEILSVEPESPAARTGLHEGDSIVALGGRPVTTVDDLHRALAGAAIGAETTVVVIRDQEKIERSVTPVEAR